MSNTSENANTNENVTTFKIHNILLNFFNNRLKKLVTIYINCLEERGEGVMLLTLTSSEKDANVDMAYFPIHVIPDNLSKDVKEHMRKNNYNRNICYFILASPEAENLIEIDLLEAGASLLSDDNNNNDVMNNENKPTQSGDTPTQLSDTPTQ